jgi:cell wall-associated NlpC family hydrolase
MNRRLACSTGILTMAMALPAFVARGQELGPSASGSTPRPAGTPIVWDSAMDAALGTPSRRTVTVAASPASAVPLPGQSSDLPKPFAAFSASARSLGDSLVALARAQLGRRYRFGGTTPEHGFDCSGLVRYVLAALHIDVPRTAREQAHVGTAVPLDPTQLRPGDLVTFGSAAHPISHIGIYVGDGRFVQASSRAGRVIETPLNRRLIHGAKPWRGVQRVMPADEPTAALVAPAASDAIDPMFSSMEGLEY